MRIELTETDTHPPFNLQYEKEKVTAMIFFLTSHFVSFHDYGTKYRQVIRL